MNKVSINSPFLPWMITAKHGFTHMDNYLNFKAKNFNFIPEDHLERYRSAAKFCKNKNVLDVACGCGYGVNILSNDAKYVTGADISLDGLKVSEEYWKNEKKVNLYYLTC